MPGFCVNCGAPVLGAFCNQCGSKTIAPGTPAQTTASPVQPVVPSVSPAVTPPVAAPPAPVFTQTAQPQMAQPIVPQPAKSGLGRALLWLGGILLVIFLIAAGGTIYGYFWVKHKVTSYASAITGGSSGEMKVVPKGDSCRLLSTAELQQVLGVPIEKSAEIVEGSDPGCAYYTTQAGYAQLQKSAMEFAKKQAAEASKRPGPKGDNPLALLKETDQMEGIVKSLTTTGNDPEGKVFSFTVQKNFGSDSWSGMRLMESAVPGFSEVNGVGDHAMVGSFGHAFYAQKGETMIHLDTTLVPDARMRGAQLGKKILGRL